MSYDRDAILDRIDLSTLRMTCSAHHGRASSATCLPLPSTGRKPVVPHRSASSPAEAAFSSPPATRGAGGCHRPCHHHTRHEHPRRHRVLAQRAGIARCTVRPSTTTPTTTTGDPSSTVRAGDEVLAYAAACEQHLWSGTVVAGTPGRAGFGDPLCARRAGGPGPAAVLRPVFATGARRRVPGVTQRRARAPARPLPDVERAGRKYDNPAEHLTPNPRHARAPPPARGHTRRAKDSLTHSPSLGLDTLPPPCSAPRSRTKPSRAASSNSPIAERS
jgi:hypothetical protein